MTSMIDASFDQKSAISIKGYYFDILHKLLNLLSSKIFHISLHLSSSSQLNLNTSSSPIGSLFFLSCSLKRLSPFTQFLSINKAYTIIFFIFLAWSSWSFVSLVVVYREVAWIHAKGK